MPSKARQAFKSLGRIGLNAVFTFLFQDSMQGLFGCGRTMNIEVLNPVELTAKRQKIKRGDVHAKLQNFPVFQHILL